MQSITEGLFLVLEPGNHMFTVIEAAIRAAITINGVGLGDDPNNVVIHCADQWAPSP